MTDEVAPVDVGDEVQVSVRKSKVKSKRDREVDELKAILATYGGRAYIWRIMSDCGVFKTSFTGEAPTTFFNEGKRHIGLHVLKELFEVDASVFQRMQQEAVSRGDK